MDNTELINKIKGFIRIKQACTSRLELKHDDVLSYQQKYSDVFDNGYWKRFYLERYLDFLDEKAATISCENVDELTAYFADVYRET